MILLFFAHTSHPILNIRLTLACSAGILHLDLRFFRSAERRPVRLAALSPLGGACRRRRQTSAAGQRAVARSGTIVSAVASLGSGGRSPPHCPSPPGALRRSMQLRAGVDRCLSGDLHCAAKEVVFKKQNLQAGARDYTTTCTGRQEGMGLRWSRLQSLQRSREEQPRRECKLQRSRKLRRAAEEICSSGSLCSGQWACTVERGLT
jgi:hypothetical protein